MKNILLACLGLFLIVAASCNQSSLLGSELFDNDKITPNFSDDLVSLRVISEAPDSELMYTSATALFPYYPFGETNDPFFGVTKSTIYANFANNVTAPDFRTTAVSYDSMFLILPYQASAIYGDTLAEQKIGVYRLSEELKGDPLYSNKTFPNDAKPLGSLTFKPTPNSTVLETRKIVNTANTSDRYVDSIYTSPHIRIPLDSNFAKQIIALDSTTYANGFATWLKGLVLKPEKQTQTMLSFNMLYNSSSARTAGMYLFYHKSGDTTQYSYRWTTGGVPRFANYQHGYKTAPIKNFLSSTTAADSLIVLQGMAGAKAKIEFPNLRSLNGKYIINKAELEFTINDDLATDKFAPISQILLLDGKSQPITDSQVAGYTSDATIFQTIPNFGGYVTNGSSATGRVYRFNISAHLQNMLNGSAGTELILYPIFKNVRSNRVVLYGPKHSKYRAKLNLTYTKV